MAEPHAPRSFALEAIVFICGAVVMVFEIIGSRVVSPFIGTSTYVWTSLIGVILGALSLGYWLGGRVADRRPDRRLLGTIIFIAGGLISVTILLKDVVLSGISSMPGGLEARSVAAALLLFAPASVALGMVTPFAARLKLSSIDDSGKTVGRLYALSTIGSIVGTFAAGFFLIPFVGSTRTLYLIAATLFASGILLAAFTFSRAKIALLIVFAFGVAANELTGYYLARTRGLRDIDTEYSRVQIFEARYGADAKPIRAMATDPYFVQSAVFLDSDELVFEYNKFYHLVRHLVPDMRKTLMIGGAGFTFPRDYIKEYPDAEIGVVEIDPQMTQLARKHFGLRDDPRMRIIHADGRVFLEQAPARHHDAVLMDAFGSLFAVPYQLTTVEAVRSIERTLKPEGVVIFNLGSAIRGRGSEFLQAEFSTYKAVFPYVHLFKVRPNYSDEQLQNLMIVACKTQCLDGRESPDAEIAGLLDRLYTDDFPLTKPVLTDELNPVEYYGSFAVNAYRK